MKILTAKQVAELLQMKSSTVYAWRSKGLFFLKMNGLLRFDEEEIVQWVKSCKRRSTAIMF